MGIELIISNNTIVLGQRKEQSNTPSESHIRKKGDFKGRERRGRDLYPTSALEAAAFPLKMIREKFIRALCPSNMHRPCQVGGLALPSRCSVFCVFIILQQGLLDRNGQLLSLEFHCIVHFSFFFFKYNLLFDEYENSAFKRMQYFK